MTKHSIANRFKLFILQSLLIKKTPILMKYKQKALPLHSLYSWG
jgi:hypothetical protein